MVDIVAQGMAGRANAKLTEAPKSTRDYGSLGTFDEIGPKLVALRDYMDSKSHDLTGRPEALSLVEGLVPAGAYRSSVSEAMMNGSFLAKRSGYSLKGAGAGYTQILSSPTDGVSFTGAISGNVLTASSVTGALRVGDTITGLNVASGTAITGLGTGTGSDGTYTVSVPQTVTPTAMSTASSKLMMYNRGRQHIRVSGFSFLSDDPTNRFFYSFAENTLGRTPQDFQFDDCEWRGAWGDMISADGDGNNSEWVFKGCRLGGPGSTADFAMGSFLYFPSTASDQQVNILIDHCYPWPSSTDANTRFIKLKKGGSLHVRASDHSGWLAGIIYDITTTSNQFNMDLNGNRFELKSQTVKVLNCTAQGGIVSIRDNNMAVNAPVQQSGTGYSNQVTLDLLSGPGPNTIIDNNDIQGRVRFTQSSTESYRSKDSLRVQGNRFYNHYDLFNVLYPAITGAQAFGNSAGLPLIRAEGNVGTQAVIATAQWARNTTYVAGNRVRNGLSEFEVVTAGTSATTGVGPTGKSQAISDGGITWKWNRSEPACYATDVVINAHQSTTGEGVQRRRVAFFNNLSQFPNGVFSTNGLLQYAEAIIPPRTYIVEAGIYIPPYTAPDALGDALGANLSAIPTWKIATESGRVLVDCSTVSTPISAGCNVVWTGRIPVTRDINLRTIKAMQTTGSEPAGVSGVNLCVMYIYYEG